MCLCIAAILGNLNTVFSLPFLLVSYAHTVNTEPLENKKKSCKIFITLQQILLNIKKQVTFRRFCLNETKPSKIGIYFE